MDKIFIEGGKPLKGEIHISGSKNAALPIMVATLLTKGISTIDNVPHLQDVFTLLQLMDHLGAKHEWDGNSLQIDTRHIETMEAPYEIVKKMRASFYVAAPLLTHYHFAKVSQPGGCAIGPRPVNLHLKAFEQLGAKIQMEEGYVIAQAKRLKGTTIFFDNISVGATCNTLMAASLASGRTILEHCACEPEVANLVDTLRLMGAQIEGKNTPRLVINGVDELQPCHTAVISDRIEAGTYAIAAVITGGKLQLHNVCVLDMLATIEKLREIGARIDIEDQSLRVQASSRLHPVEIATYPFPGLATDMQAQFMALLTQADGSSQIIETIYPERFMHAAELIRLGAQIHMDRNTARITGPTTLKGAKVMASDLRASAALVLAGLAAKKTTEIQRVYHLDRGYEKVEQKLEQVGARIWREK